MRQSPKQNRARSKNGRKSNGPSINRVYESSGPEGKVRGTPQQIIEKYLSLARDKATSGDRVMSESFLQHAEHYVRILGAAQTPNSSNARREEPETAETEAPAEAELELEGGERAEASGAQGLAVIGEGDGEGPTDIVETPENVAADRRSQRRRPAAEAGEDGEEGPRRRRRPQRRTPRAAANGAEDGESAEASEEGAVEPKPRRGRRPAAAADGAATGSIEEIGGAST